MGLELCWGGQSRVDMGRFQLCDVTASSHTMVTVFLGCSSKSWPPYPVLNNFIRFILTAAHCVISCTPCNGGRSLFKKDKKTRKNNYRIKAAIGRFKNQDLYNIIKVIQHPEYQKMSTSTQQVVKSHPQQCTQVS